MQHDTTKNLLSRTMLSNLADDFANLFMLPGMGAYHNARQKVISKVTDNGEFRSHFNFIHGEYKTEYYKKAKIHVFCPPLLQYIHFALALPSPGHGLETLEFEVVIHPDDRLLNGGLYSVEEGHESMLQLNDFVRSNAELAEPIDAFQLGVKRESRQRFLATCFDQIWMDQRITALASDKRTGDEVDASEFFRESKEAAEVVLTVIMAGPQVCDHITGTAPLVGPDNPVQPMQSYRLQELDGVDDRSLFRWKTTHFCRIYSP